MRGFLTATCLCLMRAISISHALDNGLAATPAMGYSTWNDCSSFRDNGKDGWCWESEKHVRAVTEYMISSGLARLGYVYINVDEGWLKGRSAEGVIIEDLDKFPSGMAALGSWVNGQETFPGSNATMRYGLYSSRGTCQCGTGTYSAPGSHGYEAEDAAWMVSANAKYIKIDSCCGSQDHAVAFSDYAKYRDALNATGKRVWLSLCGWEAWYSPPDPTIHYAGGQSLGNSWRIAGDGSNWQHLTECMNTQAAAAPFAGPGGWPDPDLLIGPEVYVGGQTDKQARAQFSMWCLFPANLIISQNVLNWSSYALETYSNTELIALNQDPLGSPARRIVGGDISYPCSSTSGDQLASVIAVACNASDPAQHWSASSADGLTYVISSKAFPGGVLDNLDCGSSDGTSVALLRMSAGKCAGLNQRWFWSTNGSVVNANSRKCLDVYSWVGPDVDTWSCTGGGNQNFTLLASGQISSHAGAGGQPPLCLSASVNPCTNVWGRKLSKGDFALGYVNNGGLPANVTCDDACFKTLLDGDTRSSGLVVRDLWSHRTVAVLHGNGNLSFSALVDGDGSASIFRLSFA